MDIATDQQQRVKRVRHQDPSQAAAAGHLLSPLEQATSTFQTTIASLPTTVQQLGKTSHQQITKLLKEGLNLEKTYSKFSDAAFVPKSIPKDFKLGVSKRVKERSEDKYNALLSRVDAHLATFTADLRTAISEAVKLEQKTHLEELRETACRAIGTLGCAFAIASPKVDKAKAQDLIIVVFEKDRDLLKFIHFDEFQEFFNTFHKATNATGIPHIVGSLSETTIAAVEPAVEDLNKIFRALLVTSWEKYLAAQRDIQINLELQEFAELAKNLNSTQPVAAAIAEMSSQDEAMHDAINSQVTAATKKLQDKVTGLENQIF